MTRIPLYGWIIGTPWVHCIRNLAAGWCLFLEGLLGLRWTQLLMMVGGDGLGVEMLQSEIVDGTARDLVPKMDREDQVVWTLNSNGKYCAKSAWLAIRTTNSEVVWCPLVWFNKHVPRWSFILWVALLGRLSTKDRLQSWGIAMDSNCVLCHGGVEDHNHLFFYCSFS